jgi:hypothetical protein
MEESRFGNSPQITNNTSNLFSNKNMIIIVLCGLLLLSILGINILTIVGNIVQVLTNIFGPLVLNILGLLGYTTGTVLDKGADVVSDVAKTGIDIAEGTVHSVGGILKNSGQISDPNFKTNIDAAINNAPAPPAKVEPPQPTPSENPIQNPISAGKNNWCLVGEYMGRRGCIEVGENDKCLSGQLYPTNAFCLNPALMNASTATAVTPLGLPPLPPYIPNK